MTKTATGRRILAVGAIALTALVSSAAAVADPSGNSTATIAASFDEGCRDLSVQSSKEISHLVIRYADGTVVKDEAIQTSSYRVVGGDVIDAVVVKSGTTSETFGCRGTNDPPTAVLEIETPPLADCGFNTTEYPSCLATHPRTVWSRPPSGELAFVFVSPVPPEILTFGFRGTSSTDPDDDIASWSIDFGGGTTAGGNWTTDPPTRIVHAYAAPFIGTDTTVTLTVTDAAGQSDSETIRLIGIDGTPD